MAALALLTSGAVSAATFQGYNAQLTRAPYLTDLTQTSVQVTWTTRSQYTGVVQYGPPGSCTSRSVTATKMGNPITIGSTTEYQNSVVVSGLSPSTTYCYRITNTGASPLDLLSSNPSPQFTTMQPGNGTQPFTFDVLGDWGDTTNSGSNTGSLNVNQAGVDAGIAASGAQFALSVGDVAYPNGSQTNYGDLTQTGVNVSAVFNPNYWAIPGQSTPLFQIDGNHGQNATSLGVWPGSMSAQTSGGSYQMGSYPSIDGSTPASYPDTYYAFSTGGVRFYMLDASWADAKVGTATGGACGTICAIYQLDRDAHWTVTSDEYQWLQRDLAAHPGGLKFAFFHFPLYTANATQTTDAYLDNTPGSTNSLEQLLHDNGVQLAFTGHAHIYERNIAGPGGVTNYVTGGGGGMAEPVSRCTSGVAYAVGWSYTNGKGSACGTAPKPLSDAQVYHFLKITVNGRTVTVAPTNAQGQTFDVQTYNFGADTAQPSAPGNLVMTSTKKDSFSWSAASDNVGVIGYDIYRNGIYLTTVGPQVRSYTDTQGVSGTKYTYRVDARDLAGNTASALVTTSGTADTTLPSTPSGLAASGIGYTTASLSWGASSDTGGLAYYTVIRDGTSVGQVPAGTTTYTDTQLRPGTTYSYQVVAVDLSNNSSAASNSAPVTTTSDTSSPTAPASLTGSALSTTQVLLSWGASTDNLGVVRYDVVRNGTTVMSVAGTSYVDSVAAGSTNSYQVVAYDAAGNSTPSATVVVTTSSSSDTTAPTAPSNLTATAASGTQVNLSWTGSTDNVGVAGYKILRAPSGGTPTEIASTTGTGTTYSDTTVVGTTSYDYQVEAFDAAGNISLPSNTAPVTTPDGQPPTQPGNFRVTGTTQTSITVAWDPSTDNIGVTGYNVYVGTGTANPTTNTSYTATGLSCGTNYAFAVEALDAAGNKSTQATLNGTTTACSDTQPPSAPTNLSASAVNSSQVNLSWTASSDNVGVTGYQIWRGPSGQPLSLLTSTTGTATTFSDTGVAASTGYDYQVRAFDAAGNFSDFSTTATATTPASVGVAFVGQQNFSGTTGSPTAALAYTGGTGGDFYVLIVATPLGATGNITAVTDSGGNTWTRSTQAGVSGGTNTFLSMWRTTTMVAPPGTITVTGIGVNAWDAKVVEFSGVGAADAAAVSQANATASTSLATPSTTTTNAGSLLIAAGVTPGSKTADPAGWTPLTDVTAQTPHIFSAYRLPGATGTFSATWTITSAKSTGAIASFLPA